MKFFRKYHKWLGIVLTIFILLFALSGIVLNHRKFFANSNVNRNILPNEYSYKNWNNAAIKGTLRLSGDSILAYGNVGIWLTDTTFSLFSDFNQGFPKGIDHRKIYKLHTTANSELLAATLFGLYKYNFESNTWNKTTFQDESIMDIAQKQDTTLLLTRSHLYKTTNFTDYSKHTLPEPPNYNNKVSLFKTLWIIHSGEIFGQGGKLFTDLIGLVFIFLSLTGIIYFITPKLIKRKKKHNKSLTRIVKTNRFSLKWHNKLGWTLLLFLIITTITGMFLRPPLLIAIIQDEVNKIPFTKLDTDNAWFDKLRRVIYDENSQLYYFATIDGVFIGNNDLNNKLMPAPSQPPISVMGVNVFKKITPKSFLVGSFEGLFVWDSSTGIIYDYIERKPFIPSSNRGIPIGRHMVAGYTNDYTGGQLFFDYNIGATLLNGNTHVPNMPQVIQSQPMSLWNLALEVHTMRIFNSLIGMFYILLIPLSGLAILFILISGFIVWFNIHRKKRKK